MHQSYSCQDFKIVDSSFKIGKSDPNSKEPTVAKPQFELPSDAQGD